VAELGIWSIGTIKGKQPKMPCVVLQIVARIIIIHKYIRKNLDITNNDTYIFTYKKGCSELGSSKNLIADLKKAGWLLDRVSGSHHIFVKESFAPVIVPHPRKDLKKGLEIAVRKAAKL
jgi:predicted RNA binding protein YcfA (HicA-like mRNA interferase family)